MKRALQPINNIHCQINVRLFATLACILAALEAGIWYLYVERRLPFYALPLVHIGEAVLLFRWIKWQYYHKQDIGMPTFMLMMQATFGPFGSLISFITLIAYQYYRKRSGSFIEWFATLFPEDKVNESNALYERIIFGLDNHNSKVHIEPFQDILSYGTLKQKQMALMKITRYFRPQFAPILRQALEDKEAAIRVQAATIMAKIERDFTKKYMLLEREVQEDSANVNTMMLFAELCDEYAHSGLLDEDSEKKSRTKAIEIYEQCGLLEPENDQVKLRLGRLYLRCRELEKAVRFLKECIDRQGLKSPSLVLWYMEALFYMRAFRKMRSLADSYSLDFDHQEGDMEAREVVSIFKSWNIGIPQEKMFV